MKTSIATLRAITAELDVPGLYRPLCVRNGEVTDFIDIGGVAVPVPAEPRTIDLQVGRTVRRYYDGGRGLRLLGSVRTQGVAS